MKKLAIKWLLGLGTVAMMTACGSSGGDDTPPAPAPAPAPVEVGTYSSTTCTGKQVYADSNGVQVDVTCTNPANIDLDGGTGNPAPYIQINELQVSLPADKVVSNDGATIVWHRIVYPLPSGLSASGIVVVYASNEAGDFEKVESVPFAVQTVQAPVTPTPTPDPEPTNHAPTCDSFTVNTLGDPTFTTSLASKIHDADGDALTVTYIEVVKLSGDLIFDIPNTGVSGTDATITISNGSGRAYLAYRVKDSKGSNSTECRVTFTDLVI